MESERCDSANVTTAHPAVDFDDDNVSGSCSTTQEDVEGSSGGVRGGEALALGLSAMLESVIKDFDSKAVATLKSQDDLSDALDRLVQEFDQLLENAPLPFIVQQAARISSVKQRVSSLNLVLKSIQRRIDNIDHMISANTNTSQEKTASESIVNE